MTKKHEREYFEKEWTDMRQSLRSYITTGSQNDLHDFRVQVKKLRAFLIMADDASGKQKLTARFKPVRKIFKKAGHIRNAFINLKLAKTYGIANDEFVLEQDRLMQQAADEFRLKGEKYIGLLKETQKDIVVGIKPIDDLHITHYYEAQLQSIGISMADIHFYESLHQCRKWIKVLIYNFKLAHASVEVAFNEDYLQAVQTAIGNWHDNELAKELFTSHHLDNETLTARMHRKHTRLQNKIKKLVTDFYNQATTTVELPVEQVS